MKLRSVPDLPAPLSIPLLDPDSGRLRGTVAGIAPWVIVGTAVSAAVNWSTMWRSSPALREIAPFLVICMLAFLVLARLMWHGARSGRREFTGIVGIVYLGLFASSCTLVAVEVGNEIRFALGYCSLLVVGSVFFWPRIWHFVVGTTAALTPPVLLIARGIDPDLRSAAIMFVFNTLLIAVGIFVMAQRADSRSARQAREIAYRATHDGLTGVVNRTHWLELAEQHLRSNDQMGRPTAVMVIDIDGFKRVNDTMGHEAGDRILISLAKALRQAIGSAGVVGRMGGDEFLVLLPALGLLEAERYASRIHAEFAVASAAMPETSLSIGLAERLGQESLARMLARADGRMYIDKRDAREPARIVPLFDLVFVGNQEPTVLRPRDASGVGF